MNKNIRPSLAADWAVPACAIEWTGYAGAIPADTTGIIVNRANGNTIVTTSLGESYNCHPKVTTCSMSYSDPDYKDGIYIQYDAGVYPIRFKL